MTFHTLKWYYFPDVDRHSLHLHLDNHVHAEQSVDQQPAGKFRLHWRILQRNAVHIRKTPQPLEPGCQKNE